MTLLRRMRVARIAVAAVAYLWAYRGWKILRGPSQSAALDMLNRWSRRTCRRLGVEVRRCGEVPAGPCVFIANHRSYLDIPVLASVLTGATFLSNDDVAGWPIVGAAAAEVGVIFVDRAEIQGRIRALRQIARCVRRRSIIVFPEGTTGGDRLPQVFHDGLLRLLQRLRVAAVPVSLRYSSRRAYWVEDVGVGEHLRRQVLTGSGLAVDVHLGEPVRASEGDDARVFAAAVYAAVCGPIEEHGELARPSSPCQAVGI